MISFQPWVGSNYRQGIAGQKVLVLGESHYHDCENDPACGEESNEADRIIRHSKLTYDAVDHWKDKPHSSPLSHIIPKLFEIPKENFWQSVVFYNYLQIFAGLEARTRPTKELWAEESNVEAFQMVIDNYLPDRILVLGKKLWKHLPSKNSPLAQCPQPEPNLQVSNDVRSYEESERICYWYYANSGDRALAMPIMHPAAVRFSYSDWIEPVKSWLGFE